MRFVILYLCSFAILSAMSATVKEFSPFEKWMTYSVAFVGPFTYWIATVDDNKISQLLRRMVLDVAFVGYAVYYGGQWAIDKYDWTWSPIIAGGAVAVLILVIYLFSSVKKVGRSGDYVVKNGTDIEEYTPDDMYNKGVECDREHNYFEAFRWYKKAAENGNAYGQYNLGWYYEHGTGVKRDLEEAKHWYMEAADRVENAKKRWEKLSGESYDETETDEDDEDEEVDDDETEIEYEEEEDCEGEEMDDEDECSNEDDEDETDEDDKDGLDPMEELNGLIGLDSVKKNVEELESFLELQEERQELGLPTTDMSHHCVFTGNPGTGKTVVARIIARIYYDMGIIESDKLVETDRSGLVGRFLGESAQKTNGIVDSALDGVLFIDEAHNLVSGDDDDYGKEAVATLMKRMEDDRDRLVVIVAGYPDEMRHFLDADPGLKRRFSRTIHFSDYSADELTQIFFKFVNDDEYVCPSNTKEAVVSTIRAMVEFKGKNFGNAGEIRNLYQETIRRMSQRIVNAKRRSKKLLQTILPEDLPPRTIASPDAVESILEELNHMVGLKSVKEEIRRLVKTVKVRKARERAGLKTPGSSYHCVFTGNPGTGKTTVARFIARIYHALGILATDKFVETDRSKLVAEYIGQTAPKTNDVIDSALDGVLFIDEAYTLAGKGETDFGQEAIDTLLKRMEDDRKRLVVIIAGYTNEIKKFIEANAGLRSRFTRYIDFQDYSADELLRIFMSIVDRSQYFCGDEAKNLVAEWMNDAVVHRGKGFGNGRFARSCFEKVIELQAERLFHIKSPTRKQLKELTASDIKAARYSAEA